MTYFKTIERFFEALFELGMYESDAARVLAPGGALLAFCAIGLLPDTMQALGSHLQYRWELTSAWSGGSGRFPGGFCKQARCLWYDVDGTSRPQKKIVDLRMGVNGRHQLPVAFPDQGAQGSWSKIPDHIAYFMVCHSRAARGGSLCRVGHHASSGPVPGAALAGL